MIDHAIQLKTLRSLIEFRGERIAELECELAASYRTISELARALLERDEMVSMLQARNSELLERARRCEGE